MIVAMVRALGGWALVRASALLAQVVIPDPGPDEWAEYARGERSGVS